MGYSQLEPSQRIRSLVQSIWIQDNGHDDSRGENSATRVLPTAKVDLVIYYRDPFVRIDRERKSSIPKFSLCGQRTAPIDVEATGKSGVIVVNFFPWVGARVIDHPMSELTDQMLDLRELSSGAQFDQFEDNFCSAGSIEARVDAIEEFLLSRVRIAYQETVVAAAIQRIEHNWGTLPIGDLAEGLGISQRQLLRCFLAVVGVAPKTFARIVRFQRSLYCLRSGMHWSAVVDRCGHYDQAHMIHEMRRFSGLSPTKIALRERNTPLMKSFNASPSLSDFYNTTYL